MQNKDTFHYTNKSEMLLLEGSIFLVAEICNILQIHHTAAREASKGICPFYL